MNTQKLSRQGLKEIHSNACSSWKLTLEGWGSRNPLEDYIELSQKEIDTMFLACTKDQLPIVSKYLKQDDGSVDVTKFNAGNKSAGTRARKTSQELKSLLQTLRGEILEARKND